MNRIPAFLLLMVMTTSCVSMQKYRDTNAELLSLKYGYGLMEEEVEALRARNETLEEQYDRLYKQGQGGNARAAELETLLKQRDQALAKIRSILDAALSGFEGRGLSVTQRNGMIYVSMDEKLLFETGKYEVSDEGKRAIREIGSVLADNSQINITVEGHTDNVPYRNKNKDQIEDNWDLSAKRATEVVRLLLGGSSIDPKRITASGRGQYMPIAPNTSAATRQQNRRTEIILTPQLDRLMELMDQAAGDAPAVRGNTPNRTGAYDNWDD